MAWDKHLPQELPTEREEIGSLASVHAIDGCLDVVYAESKWVSTQGRLRHCCEFTCGFGDTKHPYVFEAKGRRQGGCPIVDRCIKDVNAKAQVYVPVLEDLELIFCEELRGC